MATPVRPLLGLGEAAPWFTAPALGGARDYAFDTAAGRPILMLFFGTAAREECAAALALVEERRALFDDVNACFFGVTVDPADAARKRIAQQIPGIRFFLDYDRKVSAAFGADLADGSGLYRPHWLLLDPAQRVVACHALADGPAALAGFEALARSPPPADPWAPVLLAENVFEPALCRRLIALYEADGGEASGFMRDVEGKTKLIMDAHHKMRRDCTVADPALCGQLQLRVRQRLVPMIARAFQFEVTRMERYLIGCYVAGAGHFRPHRDNTTKGTAHRRFAVTINLNAEEYEGGDLRFPEFGRRTYRAPTGGAVVFGCSLLHEATPVTRGKRYAFLPFLYDEPAAKLREANNPYLGEEVATYRPGAAPPAEASGESATIGDDKAAAPR